MAASVTVAVDANGADLGPREVAAAAGLAAARGTRVLLFGPRAEIGPPPAGVEVIDAPLSIAKAPDPARAVRSTPDASIVRTVRAVAAGEADAFVSGGATGAALAAGVFHVRRARGVRRPALAVIVPVPGRPVLLLDSGASSEVRADQLAQFAFMGAAFAAVVLGIKRPRVALLSNGEEPSRGSDAVRAAHGLLAAAGGNTSGLRFVGNVEGTQLTSGAADVVVTDGFTGNVALKLMEGVSATLLGALRERVSSSRRAQLGGLLLRPALRSLRDELEPERQGGAYLLGLRRLGVVCHGRFSRQGFAEAIAVAERGVRGQVIERTQRALEEAGFGSRASEGAASVTDLR